MPTTRLFCSGPAIIRSFVPRVLPLHKPACVNVAVPVRVPQAGNERSRRFETFVPGSEPSVDVDVDVATVQLVVFLGIAKRA